MNKKILPIIIPPLVGYLEDAHPLSIVLAHDFTWPWFYSNYIQLFFQSPEGNNQPLKFYKVELTDGRPWGALNPWLNYHKVTKDIIDIHSINIIEFLINSIDLNNYIIIHLDEFFLPYRTQYNSWHYTHETFINGYNAAEGIFYGVAYTKKHGVYEEFSISFDELKQAYLNNTNIDSNHRLIQLLSMKAWRFYEFDIISVLEQLNEYLFSINSSLKNRTSFNTISGCFYGFDIYTQLKKYYLTWKDKASVIPLHILLEHKKLMIKRIKYMIQNEYINECQGIIDEYSIIFNNVAILKNIFIKFLINKNVDLIYNIGSLLDNISIYEKSAIENLIKHIEKSQSLINEITTNTFYSKVGIWDEVAYDIGMNKATKMSTEFDLYLFDNKSNGFFCYLNDLSIPKYEKPVYININGKDNCFDAVDDTEMRAISKVELIKNVKYHFIFKIDIENKVYDAFVLTEDGVKHIIADKFKFNHGASPFYINRLLIMYTDKHRFKVVNHEIT